MLSRNRGFTLIEILVVITIIAALAGMVVALVPMLNRQSEMTQSMNNLKQIGGILQAKQAGGKLKYFSGAAFLLQAMDEIKDDDLKVFISPSDKVFPDRDDFGTENFIESYRTLDLKAGIANEHCSYAGPNWAEFPQARAGRAALKSRLWGCDRCYKGVPFGDGICVLYDSGKTEFIDIEKIKGADLENGFIQVGKHSPDELLNKMCYCPVDSE